MLVASQVDYDVAKIANQTGHYNAKVANLNFIKCLAYTYFCFYADNN